MLATLVRGLFLKDGTFVTSKPFVVHSFNVDLQTVRGKLVMKTHH
jgi:hypothetical protein